MSNGLVLPSFIANGSVTDALPVMANFNYLLAAANRAFLFPNTGPVDFGGQPVTGISSLAVGGQLSVATILLNGVPLAVASVVPTIAGADGGGTVDDTAPVNAALAGKTAIGIVYASGRYNVPAYSNPAGVQWTGSGYVLQGGVVRQSPSRRAPVFAFGAELLHAFHARVHANSAWRITFSGDSTTLGYGIASNANRIPDLILTHARKLGIGSGVVVNDGVTGRTMKDWAQATGNAGTPFYATDLATSPQLLVVRWGINDPYVDGSTPAQVIGYLRAGLAAIRGTGGGDLKSLSILVCTPNTISSTSEGRDENYVEQIINGYRQAALDYDCAFLDIYSLFQNSRGGNFATGNAAANLWMDSPYGDARAIHPLDIFNKKIAAKMAELIFAGMNVDKWGLQSDGGTYLTKAVADLPATYPLGISEFRCNDAPLVGWAFTVNAIDDHQLQLNYGYVNGYRRVLTRHGRGNAWDAWDGVPVAPALQNGWVDFGGTDNTSAYWRDLHGAVHLRGKIKSGTIAAGTIIFALPAYYRPLGDETFVVASNGALGTIKVLAAGYVVTDIVSATYVSLSGISFLAA